MRNRALILAACLTLSTSIASAGILDCTGCHGTSGDYRPLDASSREVATGGFVGNHRTHMGQTTSASSCTPCHNNSAYLTNHRDGRIQLARKLNGYSSTLGMARYLPTRQYKISSSTVYFDQSSAPVLSTCTNVNCHFETATPTWGTSSISCTTCHGAPPAGTSPLYSGGAAGSHARHDSYYSGTANCVKCHNTYATYMHATSASRRSLSMALRDPLGAPAGTYSNPTVTGYLPGQTATHSFSSCSNTYCHSNGTSVATNTIPANTTPQWGSGTIACSGCHSSPPAYTSGSPKANSHDAHSVYGCQRCHVDTTSDGSTITGLARHVNKVYDLAPGVDTSFSYSFSATGGTCSAISCHGNSSATWGNAASVNCLGCHALAQGNRAAISTQFSGTSHHYQGVSLDGKVCYQCHWEANSDGTVNKTYHHATPGAAIELVVYGAGSRPGTYGSGTFVRYTANGSRTQIAKLNSHCTGCHSDTNNSATPFNDGKTPKQYAWDGTSVAARYSQPGTTSWGKYTSAATNPYGARKKVVKSLSAHGNAAQNQRGWDTTTGVDGTLPNTGATSNVLCYDCHNSHGSTVAGITSRYSSATGRGKGAILKDTAAGKGGYSVAYKPYSGGTATDRSKRNPGASLCLDCHLNPTAAATPWGYSATFGATQGILGYWDAPMYGSYSTSGSEKRYGYKKTVMKSGHFGTALPLSSSPASAIGGLCTPCHDPHGVSPTLGANQKNAVPLLKGTWLTSPYKEDAAPANTVGTARTDRGYGGVTFHIDQNTFGTSAGTVNNDPPTGINHSVTDSAGLCLGCHSQASLTTATTPATPNNWKSKDRIHEAVKGWKTSTGTIQHAYSCSKCHAPHTDAGLPRLMVTNCMDTKHKGMVKNNPAPIWAGSGGGDDSNNCTAPGNLGSCQQGPQLYSGGGSGRIPGAWSGSVDSGPALNCHEANTGSGVDQSWNTVTTWTDSVTDAIISGPGISVPPRSVLLHMDETSWSGASYDVKDSAGGIGATSSGAATVSGGITGNAGSFNGTTSTVTINSYSPFQAPMDNFTIEAWVKPNAAITLPSESTSGTAGTTGQKYLFWPNIMDYTNIGAGVSLGTNGVAVFEHTGNYLPALAVYSGAISSATWTHLAVVYNNKRPTIYLNGNQVIHTGLQSTQPHILAPTIIGGGVYGHYSGLVDEVSIYGSALTAADILKHYQQQCSSLATGTTANVRWQTSQAATSYVDYGVTSAYGSTVGNNSLLTDHLLTLSGLAPNTTYHYRVRSRSMTGTELSSSDLTFTTTTCQ